MTPEEFANLPEVESAVQEYAATIRVQEALDPLPFEQQVQVLATCVGQWLGSIKVESREGAMDAFTKLVNVVVQIVDRMEAEAAEGQPE